MCTTAPLWCRLCNPARCSCLSCHVAGSRWAHGSVQARICWEAPCCKPRLHVHTHTHSLAFFHTDPLLGVTGRSCGAPWAAGTRSIAGRRAQEAGECHCQTGPTANMKGETAGRLSSHASPLCCWFGQIWYFLEACPAGGELEGKEPVEDSKNARWF